MAGLRALIEDREVTRRNRQRALHALSSPWSWPRDSALEEIALAWGASPPELPGPGAGLLVSVRPDASSAKLWRLQFEQVAANAEARDFAGEALDAIDDARAAALRHVPFLVAPGDVAGGRPRAVCIAPLDQGEDLVLNGRSYGLSLALAFVSRLLCEGVRPDAVCLAQVDALGRLGAVDALSEKLAVVQAWALGVQYVLVSEAQSEEARRVAAPALEVVSCSDLSDAIRWHWPSAGTRAPAEWGRPEALRQVARKLFRLGLEGHPRLVNWAPVETAAELLRKSAQAGSNEARDAELVAAIARRHVRNAGELPFDFEFYEQFGARDAPLLRAQMVQNATDAGYLGLHEVIEGALERMPPPLEANEAELRVHGAVGRALACSRRYEEARTLLAEVVDAWFEYDKPLHASHALCELIRIHGVLRDSAAIERLSSEVAARVFAAAQVEGAAIAAAFLHRALGRAWFQSGKDALAVQELAEDAHFRDAPDEVETSRWRWLGWTYERMGRRREADEALARLRHRAHHGAFLLGLKRSAGADLERVLAELGPEESGLVRRMLACALPGESPSDLLLEEYPY